MLEVTEVDAHYGSVQALRRVSLKVDPGEVVCLIGANGAGKTTLLNLISGLIPASSGQVVMDLLPLPPGKPARAVARGVVQVPEGRQIFAPFSVRDNLIMGAYLRWKKERPAVEADLEKIFSLFPVLRERQHQPGGTLSGGEQQMLAIGRGLMARPRLLLLDEPSLGLAPMVVKEILRVVRSLPTQGCGVLLVEQNALGALTVSSRGYVLAGGRITAQGTSQELRQNGTVRAAFLGG